MREHNGCADGGGLVLEIEVHAELPGQLDLRAEVARYFMSHDCCFL
jgi:hypothetical protein